MIYIPRTDPALASFRTYWDGEFRSDLERVLAARPPKGSHDPMATIQPWRISCHNPALKRWPRRRREWFAVALYLALKLDAFVAGRHGNRYDEFAKSFTVPLFIGDCPGGCICGLDAPSVLFCLGEGPPRGRWQSRVPVIPGPALEPDVRAIVLDLKERLLPHQDEACFIVGFMEDWSPGILLDAIPSPF